MSKDELTAQNIALWMHEQLEKDTCLYQDDVVDYLVKSGEESLLIENSEGNQVLGRPILDAFKKLTPDNVVWVRSGFYWRFRVAEDEPGRDARG
ncbi:DUF6953 family protein [Pectobacterium polaris]|uniref:RNA helicase n=1 Tax=Pectobacterium polaris TaxID=2042057 RepID=A0AAW5GFU3_9GAMM|nr:hypothetical protein [Pectobacterium polaris]MCL6352205.1 hypothetical protein [Pectobacterium polaris]MCL6369604.1 hypothetical protein [Pectobacterium polaris]